MSTYKSHPACRVTFYVLAVDYGSDFVCDIDLDIGFFDFG